MKDKRITRLRPARPCPICARPSVQAFHPFCSGRCADIDLGKWLSGSYVIPAEEVGEEDELAGQDGDAEDED